jgi:hypothetical protein
MKKKADTKLLVCDFSGPAGFTALGIKLAADFGDSLALAGSPAILRGGPAATAANLT